MSKLDELEKTIEDYVVANVADEHFNRAWLKSHLTKFAIEEREAMRKFVDGINGKMIMCKNGCIGGLACSDCGIKEEWIKKSDLLNELNK